MKTALKVIIGIAAIGAIGYTTHRVVTDYRARAHIPEEPSATEDTADSPIPPADAAENVAEDISPVAAEGVGEVDVEPEAAPEVGEDLVETSVEAPSPTSDEVEAIGQDELEAMLYKDFVDAVKLFTGGTAVTVKGMGVAVTDDGRGGVSMTLTRYHETGRPIGHVVVTWSEGFSYRTDGSFLRSKGHDLERLVDLLLMFEGALDKT